MAAVRKSAFPLWVHVGALRQEADFYGGEFGQWDEWNHDKSLDWHLAQYDEHRGLQRLVRNLNRLYRSEPALYEADVEPSGFRWIAPDNADDNVIIFMRNAPSSGRSLICACNFSPVPRTAYRIGVPRAGYYREILNTDSEYYGGEQSRQRRRHQHAAHRMVRLPAIDFGDAASARSGVV